MVAKTTNYTPKVIFCEFAELPNAVTNAGNIAVVTDRSNATFISDGITWNAFAAKFNATFTALINPITGAEITFGGGSGGSTITLTASRALVSGDDGGTLIYSGSTDIILTINSGLAASGFSATVIQVGLGKVTMLQGSGVGFDNTGFTQGINTFFTIVQQSTNQYAFQNPVPSGAVPILSSNVPFQLNDAGTTVIGNNGSVTGLFAQYNTSGNCFMYFTANTIGAGVPAGWYYCVITGSTTVTVYNNPYISDTAYIPASPTPFVTTGVGAYSQVLTEIPCLTTTYKGGVMGKGGQMDLSLIAQTNNVAASRLVRMKLGGTVIGQSSSLTGTAVIADETRRVINSGVANKQILRLSSALGGTSTTAPTYGTITTNTDLTLDYHLTLAAATGFIVLHRAAVLVTYGA